MPDIEPISNDESLRRLREFLRRLENLLNELVEHPGRALPGRHHEGMGEAWRIVRPSFNTAIAELNMTADNNILSRLEAVGLTGPQLAFKLSVFQHAHDQLRDHGTPKDGQQETRGWWRRFRRFFKSALKAADVIIDSLAKAIPAVELIKEFKGSVEAGVELGDK